jgi:hypothetical protein
MSLVDIKDMLELEAALIARGFIPHRVWRLYQEVMGDHGTGTRRHIRSSVCPTESRRKKDVQVRQRVVIGYCAECGNAFGQPGIACLHCGADLYYQTRLGLNVRKGKKRK